MNIDLGLESLHSKETSDLVNVVAIADDLILLEDELHRTEKELDKLVLGYENFNAIKTVIAEHGYTDSLKELFGNQIDENVISVSDENILSTIKSVAKRAILNRMSGVQKEWTLIKEYAKEFKLASDWLKKRKKDKSVEGLVGGSLNKTYDIADILGLELMDFVSKQQWRDKRWEVHQVKSYFRTGDLDKVVEKKCKSYDLSELSDDALADVCYKAYNKISSTSDQSILLINTRVNPHNVKIAKEIASDYGRDAQHEAYDSTEYGDEHDHLSKEFYDKQSDLNRVRIKGLFVRTKLRLIRQSCRQIFAELRKRGFATHQPAN